MSLVKYKKGCYKKTIERKEKAIQQIRERTKKDELKKKVRRYSGFVSKRMKPSERYALEVLKKNNWHPQKIHGATGLPDFVCSQNRWVEVKLGGSITIPFSQVKMWDILIQDNQKIFLLLIRNIGRKYNLFRFSTISGLVREELEEAKKQDVYKPFEERLKYRDFKATENLKLLREIPNSGSVG